MTFVINISRPYPYLGNILEKTIFAKCNYKGILKRSINPTQHIQVADTSHQP